MSIWKCFQMAMSSIVGNKMRSILTMLGIIIGITAVIALVSLMSGMTSEITETFEEMGIESINVSIQDRSATKEVKPEEMEQLAEEHSDIIAGQSPTVSMPAFIKNGSDTISTQATGVNEYYLGMKKYNITYGRELTYVDVERKQKVCVIPTDNYRGLSNLFVEHKLFQHVIVRLLDSRISVCDITRLAFCHLSEI